MIEAEIEDAPGFVFRLGQRIGELRQDRRLADAPRTRQKDRSAQRRVRQILLANVETQAFERLLCGHRPAPPRIEPLEDRQYFAGTKELLHGHDYQTFCNKVNSVL